MKLKYYVLMGVIYIASVFGGLYYINSDEYTLNDLGISLPIPVWIVLPLVVFFLLSIMHMMSVAVLQAVRRYRFKRDYAKLVNQIFQQMMFHDVKSRPYSDAKFKELSDIISKFVLIPKLDSKDSNNREIDEMFDNFRNINKGSVVTINNINSQHPYFLINLKNMSSDYHNAYNILSMKLENSCYVDCAEINYMAWDALMQSDNKKLINKVLANDVIFCFEVAKKVLLFQSDRLVLSSDVIVEVLKKSSLSSKQYLELIFIIRDKLKPENIQFWLDVYDRMSKLDEKSVFAYFYLLLEVGKTDEAKYLKSQFPREEYLSISAYMDLKDRGYPLLLFFDPLYYMEHKGK